MKIIVFLILFSFISKAQIYSYRYELGLTSYSLDSSVTIDRNDFPSHAQGFASNGDTTYISFTDSLVKALYDGTVLSVVATPNHSGDPSFYNNKVYVPYSSSFNGTDALSSIIIYDSYSLAQIDSFAINFPMGAGAVSVWNDTLYIAGGLVPDSVYNHIAIYDTLGNFIRLDRANTGYTYQGVQALNHIDGYWYFGAKTSPSTVRILDRNFNQLAVIELEFTYGFEKYGGSLIKGKSIEITPGVAYSFRYDYQTMSLGNVEKTIKINATSGVAKIRAVR